MKKIIIFRDLKTDYLQGLLNGCPSGNGLLSIYLLIIVGLARTCFVFIGKDLLPKTNNGQLQLRIREPDGTRLEITERDTRNILNLIDSTVHGNVAITSAYVGTRPQ